MNNTVRHVRDFLVSLKLTVVLLAFSLVLVFASTWAQKDYGIWAVQEEFYRSWIAIWHVGALYIPMPGGYAVGGLLFANLIAAHLYRFKFAWRKSGIFLTHLGLILLLVGELLTGLWQKDYSLRLEEGETKNYAESYRENELAITDTSDPAFDDVVAIPESVIADGGIVQHPRLPFRVTVKAYYPNSNLGARTGEAPNLATTGFGERLAVIPLPLTYAQDDRNIPAAYIELVGAEGPLGTWLVSAHPRYTPQAFEYGGKSWKIAMRFQRSYKPFTVSLLDFTHDVYAGTNTPKNFSSRVRVSNAYTKEDFESLIYMNNPLRYSGLTFYQASYDGERTTVLQVVRNPSWQLPYLACALVTLGLVVQFGIHLAAFIGKRRKAATVP